jgi:TPR repeat protein
MKKDVLSAHTKAQVLMKEAFAVRRLAEFGIDPIKNLKKTVSLCETARHEGFVINTPEYADALIREGDTRRMLAELGIDPEDNLKRAVSVCQRARYKGIKNTPKYAEALITEGVARLQLSELRVDLKDTRVRNVEKAIKLFERAANEGFTKHTHDYAKAIGNIAIARGILAQLGVNQIKNLKEAISFVKRARNEGFSRNTVDYAATFLNEGTVRQNLAELGIEKTLNLDRAESLYFEARAFFGETNNWKGLIEADSKLGRLNYLRDKMSESYSYLREAIQLIEKIRSSTRVVGLRKDYFNTVINTYKFMVFACIALNKNEDAFRYAECAKGRAFVELLAAKKKGIKSDHSLVDPISLGELSSILKGRTLVEYFLGQKLAIFVVNKGLNVKIVDTDEIEVFKKMIEFTRLAEDLEKTLKIDGTFIKSSDKAEEILKDLYRLLIEPIKELDLSDEIVIVPHSSLNYLPFYALKGDRYLIEDYKICFAQSASSLKFLGKSHGEGALVVGNPTDDLRFAEAEALEVGELRGTKPILRSDAKKDVILKKIEGKRILHFACHAKCDYFNPAFSRLLLSDGSLTAVEFMDLEMDAELMVLSSCETGLAEIWGVEVEGLVRAIQYGGCRFVIASLWKVDDESTKELFLRFYNEKGDMIDKLRKAVLGMMKKSSCRFFHWAPFQIYGI